MRLIYILSSGHSGSTVLGSILGNLQNAIHIGEFSNLYKVYTGELETCSCGKLPHDCEFWNEILDSVFTNETIIDYEQNRFQVESTIFKKYDKSLLLRYSEYAQALFNSISSISETNIIIDSSKSPNRALALSKVYTKELTIVYLKRNLKGVVSSYKKKRKQNFNLTAFLISSLKEHYKFKFLKIKAKSRFVSLNFEELMNQKKLDQFLDKIKLDKNIKVDQTFKNKHIIAGNRIRYKPEFKLNYNNSNFNFTPFESFIINIFSFIRNIL